MHTITIIGVDSGRAHAPVLEKRLFFISYCHHFAPPKYFRSPNIFDEFTPVITIYQESLIEF